MGPGAPQFLQTLVSEGVGRACVWPRTGPGLVSPRGLGDRSLGWAWSRQAGLDMLRKKQARRLRASSPMPCAPCSH